MRRLLKSGVYILICLLAAGAAAFAVYVCEALAYDIVAIFIALIILSNCLAKLYSCHILKQDI